MTEEELKAAKKTLQIDLSEQMLNPQANIEALGAHTLFAGNSIPSQAGSMSEMIAMVSLADVQVIPAMSVVARALMVYKVYYCLLIAIH